MSVLHRHRPPGPELQLHPAGERRQWNHRFAVSLPRPGAVHPGRPDARARLSGAHPNRVSGRIARVRLRRARVPVPNAVRVVSTVLFTASVPAGRLVRQRCHRVDARVLHLSAVVHSGGRLFRAGLFAGVSRTLGLGGRHGGTRFVEQRNGSVLPLALFLGSLRDLRPLGMETLRRAARRRETYLSFALLVLSTLIFAGLRQLRGSADPWTNWAT